MSKINGKSRHWSKKANIWIGAYWFRNKCKAPKSCDKHFLGSRQTNHLTVCKPIFKKKLRKRFHIWVNSPKSNYFSCSKYKKFVVKRKSMCQFFGRQLLCRYWCFYFVWHLRYSGYGLERNHIRGSVKTF